MYAIRSYYVDYQHQQDAREVSFLGGEAQIYAQTEDMKGTDRNSYLNAEATLQFDLRMHEYPAEMVNLAMHCEWPCLSEVKLAPVMNALPPEEWTTLKVLV